MILSNTFLAVIPPRVLVHQWHSRLPQIWAEWTCWITGVANHVIFSALHQIYVQLLNNGFELKVVEEAEPPKEMMDIPGMEDELRRPMMLLVKAIAKK